MLALKAALTKAMEWEIVDAHPLEKLKLLKVDWSSKVRLLSAEEEQQLRQQLDDREDKLRKARDNANI